MAGRVRRTGLSGFPKQPPETTFRIGEGPREFRGRTGGARDGAGAATGPAGAGHSDTDGWRSVTQDAWGIVEELSELRPDLAYGSVPLIVYRDSMGQWDAMQISPAGIFGGFVPIGARSEAEAVAWVLARHG